MTMTRISTSFTLALAVLAALLAFNGCKTVVNDPVEQVETAPRPLPFAKTQTAMAELLDESPITVSDTGDTKGPDLERAVKDLPARMTSRPEEDMRR